MGKEKRAKKEVFKEDRPKLPGAVQGEQCEVAPTNRLVLVRTIRGWSINLKNATEVVFIDRDFVVVATSCPQMG